MEQNRQPRSRATQMCPTNFWHKMQKLFNGGKIYFLTHSVGEVGHLWAEKNEPQSKSYSIDKN